MTKEGPVTIVMSPLEARFILEQLGMELSEVVLDQLAEQGIVANADPADPEDANA